jgi:hypothetical protein
MALHPPKESKTTRFHCQQCFHRSQHTVFLGFDGAPRTFLDRFCRCITLFAKQVVPELEDSNQENVRCQGRSYGKRLSVWIAPVVLARTSLDTVISPKGFATATESFLQRSYILIEIISRTGSSYPAANWRRTNDFQVTFIQY